MGSDRGGSRVGASLLTGVRHAVVRHRLLAPGDHVLVGVSGGPDSVALLHALTALRSEYRLELLACHVHHGLRVEADRDAAFVERLAARLGVPAIVERVAIRAVGGCSPEEAARAARYAAFGRALRRTGAVRLAVGHTADDQAETVLMRLLDGAGPRGLAGIPARRGPVIRPLLDVDRAAVLDHLAAHGLDFVEDATNRDPRLLRNRIRHELLPLLRAHGWPRIDAALRRTARAAREATEALEGLLRPRLAGRLTPDPVGVTLDLEALAGLPSGAIKTLLRLALADTGRATGLRASHLDALATLVDGPVGARVRLGGGLVVERGRTGLWMGRRDAAPAATAVPVAVPGETRAGRVHLLAEAGSPPAALGDGAREAWFDAARLPAQLAVRRRRAGDRVVPFGGTTPVRVAGLLAAAGVPRAARAAWPLLVGEGDAGETVLWVVGVRRSDAAPVGPMTTTALRIRAIVDPPGAEREEMP